MVKNLAKKLCSNAFGKGELKWEWIGYLAEEISKQSVEGAVCFVLTP